MSHEAIYRQPVQGFSKRGNAFTFQCLHCLLVDRRTLFKQKRPLCYQSGHVTCKTVGCLQVACKSCIEWQGPTSLKRNCRCSYKYNLLLYSQCLLPEASNETNLSPLLSLSQTSARFHLDWSPVFICNDKYRCLLFRTSDCIGYNNFIGLTCSDVGSLYLCFDWSEVTFGSCTYVRLHVEMNVGERWRWAGIDVG